MTAAAFDAIAGTYDALWTHSDVGRLQRAAFWRHVDPLFTPGQTILDLGCGTGDDALHLSARGLNVVALDASPEMIRIARSRGVAAQLCRLENLSSVEGRFDGAISNFGALNCLETLSDLEPSLARLITPAGYFAACVLGRFCLWETLWYALHGDLRKATRRWSGKAPASLGLTVRYPSVYQIRKALSPAFVLMQAVGIGVCVPPSFVSGLPPALLRRLGRIDEAAAGSPGLRALSDHRLLIFRRS